MGFCKSFKKAGKRLWREITPIVARDAAAIITGLAGVVADGKITKDEAEALGADALQRIHGVSRTAAKIAMNITHEALTKAAADIAELGVDDSAEEGIEALLGE